MLEIEVYDRLVRPPKTAIRLVYNLGKKLTVNRSVLGQFDMILVDELEDLLLESDVPNPSYAVFYLNSHAIRGLFHHQSVVFECDVHLA
ncbi:hypothetical protein BN1356_00524 [Streptococcus varani]|uniref:Uncharacterized protein n=1 Tax=Streptococcus varani TaxID=1608583 RepID=A0A0E4H3L0_9STRE|nr:hypothetical protein [Streptococcus varani]CQR24163.1 hypothetical protein BN1356_00524 [Streptococcus varani]